MSTYDDNVSESEFSRDALSTVASSDASDILVDLDDTKVKLYQMKRNAANKGKASTLLNKFKNVMSNEDRDKLRMAKRMNIGLRTVLGLHNAIELSAICGMMQLRPLERAEKSIDQIVAFCKINDGFNENLIRRTVNTMGETAIVEYLMSIGHPLTSLFSDPRPALMRYWQNGGFLNLNNNAFTPHYVAKRVILRASTNTPPDVQIKIDALSEKELELKKLEREVFRVPDYNNVYTFFQVMHKLREQEGEFRTYMVSSLSLARTEEERAMSNLNMLKTTIGYPALSPPPHFRPCVTLMLLLCCTVLYRNRVGSSWSRTMLTAWRHLTNNWPASRRRARTRWRRGWP